LVTDVTGTSIEGMVTGVLANWSMSRLRIPSGSRDWPEEGLSAGVAATAGSARQGERWMALRAKKIKIRRQQPDPRCAGMLTIPQMPLKILPAIVPDLLFFSGNIRCAEMG
jgi:hypothetical protein